MYLFLLTQASSPEALSQPSITLEQDEYQRRLEMMDSGPSFVTRATSKPSTFATMVRKILMSLLALFGTLSLAVGHNQQLQQEEHNELGAEQITPTSILQSEDTYNRRSLKAWNDGRSPLLVDGTFSMHFDSCFSMATEADLSSASPHTQSQTSVVVFELCQHHQHGDSTTSCSRHVLDLHTFLSTVKNQPVQDRQKYCQACQESMEYCFFDSSAASPSSDAARRQRGSRVMDEDKTDASPWLLTPVESIDCQTCHDRNCFDDDETETNLQQEVLEWMDDLLSCQPLTGLPALLQDVEVDALYASFMCNQDGSGVEVALFVDPDCTMYTSSVSFSSLLSSLSIQKDTDIQFWNRVMRPALQSSELVTAPFVQPMPCANIDYTSPEKQLSSNIQQVRENETPWHKSSSSHTNIRAMNSCCQSLWMTSAHLDTCHPKHRLDSDDFTYLLAADERSDLSVVCSLAASSLRLSSSNTDNLHLWNVYQERNDLGSGSGRLYGYDTFGDNGNSTTTTTIREQGWQIRWLLLFSSLAILLGLGFISSWMVHEGGKEESVCCSHGNE